MGGVSVWRTTIKSFQFARVIDDLIGGLGDKFSVGSSEGTAGGTRGQSPVGRVGTLFAITSVMAFLTAFIA